MQSPEFFVTTLYIIVLVSGLKPLNFHFQNMLCLLNFTHFYCRWKLLSVKSAQRCFYLSWTGKWYFLCLKIAHSITNIHWSQLSRNLFLSLSMTQGQKVRILSTYGLHIYYNRTFTPYFGETKSIPNSIWPSWVRYLIRRIWATE